MFDSPEYRYYVATGMWPNDAPLHTHEGTAPMTSLKADTHAQAIAEARQQIAELIGDLRSRADLLTNLWDAEALMRVAARNATANADAIAGWRALADERMRDQVAS